MREGAYAVAVQERGTWGEGTTWQNCEPEETHWLVESEDDMVCVINGGCIIWLDALSLDRETGFMPVIGHRCAFSSEHYEEQTDGWARFAEGQIWIWLKGTKTFACDEPRIIYNDFTVSVHGFHVDD